MTKHDVKSFDFTVICFLMKLFKSAKMDIVNDCLLYFYPRDVLSAVLATGTWLCGWLAGWLDDTRRRYCIKTAKPILKLFDRLVAPSF